MQRIEDQRIPETLRLAFGRSELGALTKLENESDVDSRSEIPCKEGVVAVAFSFWRAV